MKKLQIVLLAFLLIFIYSKCMHVSQLNVDELLSTMIRNDTWTPTDREMRYITHECKNSNFSIQDFKVRSMDGTWYPIIHSEKTLPLAQFYCDNMLTFSKGPNRNYAITASVKQRGSIPIFDLKLFFRKTNRPNTFTLPKMAGVESKMTVVSTDYDSYAILYSCSDLSLRMKIHKIVVLSRKPNMSKNARNKVKEAMKANFPNENLDLIDQPQCPS